MAAEIKVRFVNKRTDIATIAISMGTVYYCKDISESFFDEDPITRISLGTNIVISSLTVKSLPNLTESNIGTCAVIVEDNSFYTFNKDLKWVKLTSSDELLSIIGTPERFIPHSLYKLGNLIAPRTLMSCVYDDTGIPVGDQLKKVINWMNNIIDNGIDASWIKTGILNLNVIPRSATMDYVVVDNAKERLSLTIDRVQNGDVVQEADTSKAFFVVDETKLGTEAAFKEFVTSSTPWNGILNRPISLSLSGGANGSVSFDTNTSTRLAMTGITLDMANVTNGILSKEHGGTGNQNGRAASVEHIGLGSGDDIYLAGYNPNNGNSYYSTLASISKGSLKATGFIATNENTVSKFNNTEINGMLTMRPTRSNSFTGIAFNTDLTGTNTINAVYTDLTSKALVIGDQEGKHKTHIFGSNISIGVFDDTSCFNITKFNKGGTDNILTIYSPSLIIDNIEHKFGNGLTVLGNTTTMMHPTIGYDILHINSVELGTYSTGGMEMIADNYSVAAEITAPNVVFTTSKGNLNSRYAVFTPTGIYTKSIGVTKNITATNIIAKGVLATWDNYNMDGRAKEAVNSYKFNGKTADQYVLKTELSGNTLSSVVIQSSAPTGRTNCLWINSSTGVANYWTGKAWTPISSTWKNA